MFSDFPKSAKEALGWNWENFSPFYDKLHDTKITEENINQWLTDWNSIQSLINEIKQIHHVNTLVDTTDEVLKRNYFTFTNLIHLKSETYSLKLSSKLIESGIQPENFRVPLRIMETDVRINNAEDQELLIEVNDLIKSYQLIVNNQTIHHESREYSFQELNQILQNPSRDFRENIWRKMKHRQLQDKEKINKIWTRIIELRTQIARNSGYQNYTEVLSDYIKLDNLSEEMVLDYFKSVRDFVMPVAQRTLRRRQEKLDLPTLKPWDLDASKRKMNPLRPFSSIEDLTTKTKKMLSQIDPEFSVYYQSMIDNKMMHLEYSKHKSRLSSFVKFPYSKSPYIFQNALNLDYEMHQHLHKVSHSIHFYDMKDLPYLQQRDVKIGISETIAISLNLILSTLLDEEHGGFYSTKDALRSIIALYERIVLQWSNSLIIMQFQIWVYRNPELASDPAQCDQKWKKLNTEHFTSFDYEGLDAELSLEWQNIPYMFEYPLFYLELSISILVGLQIYENYKKDPKKTIKNLRQGMSLGNTKKLPQLYSSMGIKFTLKGTAVLRTTANLLQFILDLEEKIKSM